MFLVGLRGSWPFKFHFLNLFDSLCILAFNHFLPFEFFADLISREVGVWNLRGVSSALVFGLEQFTHLGLELLSDAVIAAEVDSLERIAGLDDLTQLVN